MAHKNSGKKVAIAAIVIVVALVALYGITPYAITTKISNLKPNTVVYIYGTVEKRLAFGQFSGFNMSDGTGSVFVIWNGTLPAPGDHVLLPNLVMQKQYKYLTLKRFHLEYSAFLTCGI